MARQAAARMLGPALAPLLLLLLSLSSPSDAADHYACDCGTGAEAGCTNGSNASTGASAAEPWQTYDRLQDAVVTSACGDTFNFCKGGYFVVSGTPEWTVPGQDCSGNPRIIGAYQPGAFKNDPVVTASGATFNFGASGARGITLRDIDLVCSGSCNAGVGSVLANVNNVRLERVLVDGFNVGIQVASEYRIEIVKSTIRNNKNQGVIGQAGTGTLIEESLFKNNGCLTGTADDCGFQHALYFNNLTANNGRVIVVRNNTFDANCVDAYAGRKACNGNVVALRGGTGVSVTDNVFLSPLHPEAMAGCSVVRMAASTDPNQVCTNCAFSRNRVIGGHGLFEFESWIGGVVENNVFYAPTTTGVAAAKAAISHQPSVSGARPSVKPIIRNNSIVVGSSAGGFPAVGLDLRENAGTTRVYSNAIRMLGAGTDDACFRLFSGIGLANLSEDYNLCDRVNVRSSWASYPAPRTLAQYQTDSANGDHSREADPGFVNPPADFRLAPGSLGIDAGDPVNSAPNDLGMVVRPAGAAADVGAFEYRGALSDGRAPADMRSLADAGLPVDSMRNVNLAVAVLAPGSRQEDSGHGATRSAWHFQANDDTRGGWLAVSVYLLLVFLCWREVRRHYSAGSVGDPALRLPFWLALSLFVTALAVNKQLDLQVLLHGVVRDIAISRGFYEYRRPIGAAFVGVTAMLVGLVLSALWRLARRANRPERWVLIGTVALAGFALIRVAGVNHIQLLGTLDQHRPLLALELATLTFLSFAVWRNAARARR